MLISTTELNSILDDPEVIIADTRSFKEYSEGHVPGAVPEQFILIFLHFIGLIPLWKELRILIIKLKIFFHFLE
jgi:rhodanese-related sulfurtransferase